MKRVSICGFVLTAVILSYLLSILPVSYFYGRGWVTAGGVADKAVTVIYRPLNSLTFDVSSRQPRAGFGWLHEGIHHFGVLGLDHND